MYKIAYDFNETVVKKLNQWRTSVDVKPYENITAEQVQKHYFGECVSDPTTMLCVDISHLHNLSQSIATTESFLGNHINEVTQSKKPKLDWKERNIRTFREVVKTKLQCYRELREQQKVISTGAGTNGALSNGL